MPPGLAFITLSKKAWEFNKNSNLPKFYLDLSQAHKNSLKKTSPWTQGEFEIGGKITIFKENDIVYFRKTSYLDRIRFFARRNVKNIIDLFE